MQTTSKIENGHVRNTRKKSSVGAKTLARLSHFIQLWFIRFSITDETVNNWRIFVYVQFVKMRKVFTTKKKKERQ